MDEPVDDDETNRRRRRALIVFFAFVLMTAVGIGSLVLLLRDSEDVELARESGVKLPSGGATVTPTAAVSVTTVSTTVETPTSSVTTPAPAAGLFAADVGFGPFAGIPVFVDGSGASDGGTGGDGGVTTSTSTANGPSSTTSTSTSTSTSPSTSPSTSGGAPTTGLPFTMEAPERRALYPGLVVPLNIRFVNPNEESITLTSLTVRITGVGPAGCSMSDNFRVVAFRGDLADIVVPAGDSTTLADLGVPAPAWPQLEMRETGRNQNACQGVSVTLDLSGTATGGDE